MSPRRVTEAEVPTVMRPFSDFTNYESASDGEMKDPASVLQLSV
jgi:hypothetical protein